MDKTALVSVDIEQGSEILAVLDRAKLKVSVALWANLSEYDDWRFVVSSRRFETLSLRNALGLLHDCLAEEGFTAANTPAMMILPMADPFIRELRRIFAKTKSVEGMRLGGQMIGDRFVQEAYVYRIS